MSPHALVAAGTRHWEGMNRTGASVEPTATGQRQLSWVKHGWFLFTCATAGAGFPAHVIEIGEVLWDNFCSLT